MTSIACTLDIDEAEATAWPDGNHTKASSKASTEPTSLTTARVYEPRGQAHGSSSITPSSGEWATSREARRSTPASMIESIAHERPLLTEPATPAGVCGL